MSGWYGFRVLYEALNESKAQFEDEEVLQDHALAAYSHCSHWFGEASDPTWHFKLIRWHRSMCYRDPFKRRYVLMISDTGGLETVYCAVGHEMYHRVTWGRSGLRRQVWVDEMLAWATSFSIMCLEGMASYAKWSDTIRSHFSRQ